MRSALAELARRAQFGHLLGREDLLDAGLRPLRARVEARQPLAVLVDGGDVRAARALLGLGPGAHEEAEGEKDSGETGYPLGHREQSLTRRA
jgi:hypothetical protein